MAEHGKIYYIVFLTGASSGNWRPGKKETFSVKGGRSMEDIIILVDENGEEQEYELLDTIEYEGDRYVVLIREEEDSVVILKVESEEDEELSLVSCDDDVIEEVYHIFKDKNTENFDFDD